MYIEMIDETGQVSEKLKEQTLELLDFAAQRLGKEDKEMAVTFVTNERSHELNLEYRDTDRPTDVISLEYKPELDISFDEEELAENPELAEMMGEFDSYIGELFISVDKAHEQAEEYGHSFERDSQKGIVIGKQGSMLKKIGTLARKDIEVMLGDKVFLETWVKVKKNWRDKKLDLADFGYNEKEY